MRIRNLVIGLCLAIPLVIMLKDCSHPPHVNLKPTEDAIIEIHHDEIKIHTSTGTTTLPDYGHGVDITKNKDGLSIVPNTHGWSFDGGVGTANNRLALIGELYYYKRLSWITGVAVYPLPAYGFTGLGYRFGQRKINNTSIYIGYSTEQHIVGGIFLRFGSS